MNKKGGLVFFLSILAIVAILISGTLFYLYNFHVFKTLRVCLTDGENTNLPCDNSSQCRNFASIIIPKIDLGDAPEFVNNSFSRLSEETIYCDETCFVRDFRGVNPDTRKLELLENCTDDEIEISVDIRGKEAIETLKWLKKSLNKN